MEVRYESGEDGADPAVDAVLTLLRAAVGSRHGPPLGVWLLEPDTAAPLPRLPAALVRSVVPDDPCAPEGLRRAVNLVVPGGWVVVAMTCRGLDAGARHGAGRLFQDAVAAGMLRLRLQQGFLMPGPAGPTPCRAVLTRKAADIPVALLNRRPG